MDVTSHGSHSDDRTALLPAGIDGEVRFVAHRARRRDRLMARIRTQALDRQLADGASPDDGRLRAARAAVLVEPRARAGLAGHWEAVVERAVRPRVLDARVPVPRARVLAVEDQIHAVAAALRAPLPVPVRGVAMARLLLTDGTGPLYRPDDDAALRPALLDALEHLDPATELMA